MKKILLIAGSALLVVAVLAGVLVWRLMGRPMYEPGKLASSASPR